MCEMSNCCNQSEAAFFFDSCFNGKMKEKMENVNTHHLLIVYSFGIKLDSFFILLFLKVLVSFFLHFITFLVEGDQK